MPSMAASGLRAPTSPHSPTNDKRAVLSSAASFSRSSSYFSSVHFKRCRGRALSKKCSLRCYTSDEEDPSRKLMSKSRDGWGYTDALSTEQEPREAPQSVPFLPNLVARVLGPAIFEASKLKVLFLGVDVDKHPEQLPRTYTLTHNDITAKLTLAVSQNINKAQLQGWYRRLQRDDVVAKWMKSQGSMSLHVHCHISGGHWLLEAIAKLRFYIFRRELPVVLEAFRHGDRALLRKHPELEEAMVWVYFHSNVKEFDRVECWGPLAGAAKGASQIAKETIHSAMDDEMEQKWPVQCVYPCDCCFPPRKIISLSASSMDEGCLSPLEEEQRISIS